MLVYYMPISTFVGHSLVVRPRGRRSIRGTFEVSKDVVRTVVSCA